jgi:hypothetical protein
MMLVAAVVLVIGVLVFTLFIRAGDLPELEVVSPVKHLEERKATIYENLRDLQFEYRVGKLSDQDYNQTKRDLQGELAAVLAEIDKVLGTAAPAASVTAQAAAANGPAPAAAATAPPATPKPSRDREGAVCPHCGAHFSAPMKFCGDCGKPISVETAK